MENNVQNKKTNWQIVVIMILVVIIAVISIFSIGKMNELTDAMNAMRGQHASEVSSLRNEISAIYDTVDEQLKKQNSLVSSVEFTLGDLNTQTHQVPVKLQVVPKNITEGMELSVRIGDTVAEFTQDGSLFTATVPVSMFLEYETYPVLSIRVGDETQTELLDQVEITELYYNYLPDIYAETPSFYEVSNGKLILNETLRVDCKAAPSDVSITKLALVIAENGKELERKDLTNQIQNGTCKVAMNGSYSLKDGDELVIYAIAEDSLGYVHKSISYCWQYNGGDGDVTEIIGGSNYIYDSEGNLLNGY